MIMCGGGGGGSASQDALAQEQNLQMQRNNARQQNEDLARQRAIAQINQLYGIDSQVNGSQVEEVAYVPPPVVAETPAVTATESVTPSGKMSFGGAKVAANTPTPTKTLNGFGGLGVKNSAANQPAAGAPQFINKQYAQTYDGSAQRTARSAGYDAVRQNALGVALDSLSRQRDEAGRNVRFNVARSGLTGGSVDVDEHQSLADRYSQGVIQANAGADGIVNNVRGKDESTRADLISRINAGMDANSASQAALAQIQNNQNIAKVEGQSNLLSNFFNGIASGIGGYQYGYGAGASGLDPNKAAGGTVYNTAGYKGGIS
jgi:hypothetical protein